MKVINEYGCYIEVKDILYLYKIDSCFPNDLLNYIIRLYGNNIDGNAYIRINVPKYIDYIKNNKLLFDYDFLNSKTYEELNELIDEIIRDSYLKEQSVNVLNEKYNRRYLISQIKEVQNKKNMPVRKLINI